MFKKSSAAMNKYKSFLIHFSSIFHEKSKQNCASSTKDGFAHKKSTKIPDLERSFPPKSRFFVDFPSPSGVMGASRDAPGAFQKPSNLRKFSVSSERRPGPAPGKPQGGPGCPPGVSRAPFWVDLGSIFGVISTHSFRDALMFQMQFSLFCFFLCTLRLCT